MERRENDCAVYALAVMEVTLSGEHFSTAGAFSARVEQVYDRLYAEYERRQKVLIEHVGTDDATWKAEATRLGFQRIVIKGSGLALNDLAERWPHVLFLAQTRNHLSAIINGVVLDSESRFTRRPTSIWAKPLTAASS